MNILLFINEHFIWSFESSSPYFMLFYQVLQKEANIGD